MSGRTEKSLPTPREFERQLTHFINTTLLGGSDAVRSDTRLFEDGYINSLRILDLIAVIERTLGRRIPDRAVRLANFRTVATIVHAFHPDAGTSAHAAQTSDTLVEQRTSRAGFASPMEGLTQRGDVVLTGTGHVGLSGLALDVFRAVDQTVVRWASRLGAVERSYPSLIDLDVLEQAGQVESFPEHLTLATHSDTTGHARHALAPAVCYHVYPEWRAQAIGAEPTVWTACGRCYRYEGGQHVPLERLWEFSMREIGVLGARDQVESVRQTLIADVWELVTTLGLDGAIVLATDPFFTSGDEGRRLMQQAGALKYELRLTVEASGRRVAVTSFNHHHEHFGRRFDIALPNGAPAHTGCVAFGLERWVLALLAQYGIEERRWPDAARQWLHETRSSTPATRAPSSGRVDA